MIAAIEGVPGALDEVQQDVEIEWLGDDKAIRYGVFQTIEVRISRREDDANFPAVLSELAAKFVPFAPWYSKNQLTLRVQLSLRFNQRTHPAGLHGLLRNPFRLAAASRFHSRDRHANAYWVFVHSRGMIRQPAKVSPRARCQGARALYCITPPEKDTVQRIPRPSRHLGPPIFLCTCEITLLARVMSAGDVVIAAKSLLPQCGLSPYNTGQ